MQIRCPHCKTRHEVDDDSPLNESTCPSCGSGFGKLISDDTRSYGLDELTETQDFSSQPQRLDHFELLESVGSGAFATVWKARDTELDRLVAVKIPKRQRTDEKAVEMFFREARAAAQLRHPGIVSVHEVGRQDDSLYIVSDFIEGVTLREWLRTHESSLRQSAELTVKLADAVQHAHDAGVVHRDLKPANVMIELQDRGQEAEGDRPVVPKLTDFGLARRETMDATITVKGYVMGTPAYMSPEQAQGEGHLADRRSDVYSLGVILYELLAGSPPFRGQSIRMLIQQILHDEPPSPSKLNSQIPRDLETICLKCLRKNPDRRYQKSSELEADLQRWLNKEPIEARPIGRVERLVLWSQRRPAVAALLATVVLVAVVGFGLVTWQWRRAESNYADARANFEESVRQREHRDINFKKALEAVDKMLTRVGSESLANVPGMSRVRRELLQDALAFYRDFLQDKTDDPQLVEETGRAYRRIGQIHAMMNEDSEAEQAFAKSVALFDGFVEEHPQRSDFRRELAASCAASGSHLVGLSRFNAAEPLIRRAVKINQALIRESNDNTQHELDLASVHRRLATLLEHSQREKEADQEYMKALKWFRTVKVSSPRIALHRSQWALCHFNFAGLLEKLARAEDAEQHYGAALKLRVELVKDFPAETRYRSDLAASYRLLGQFLINTGRLPDAQLHMDNAVGTFEKLAKDFPHVPSYRYSLGSCCNSMAILHIRRGNMKQAEHFFRREVTLFEKLSADFPEQASYAQQLGTCLSNLGQLFHSTRRADLGVEYHRRALAVRRKLLSQHANATIYRYDVAISCGNLGYVLPDEKYDEAVTLLQEAIRLGELLSAESPQMPRYRHKLGQAYRSLGDRLSSKEIAKAEKYLNKANETFSRLTKDLPRNPKYRRFLVYTLDRLAYVNFNLGRLPIAERYYREAVANLKKLTADFSGVAEFQRERAAGQIALGRFLGLAGKLKESLETLHQAQKNLVKLDQDAPNNANIEQDLLRTHDRLARALAFWAPAEQRDLKRALEHARKATAGDENEIAYQLTLSMVHYRLGNFEAALRGLRTDDIEHCFLLAMTKKKLKDDKEARRMFKLGMSLLNKERLPNFELKVLQREAKRVLGQ